MLIKIVKIQILVPILFCSILVISLKFRLYGWFIVDLKKNVIHLKEVLTYYIYIIYFCMKIIVIIQLFPIKINFEELILNFIKIIWTKKNKIVFSSIKTMSSLILAEWQRDEWNL